MELSAARVEGDAPRLQSPPRRRRSRNGRAFVLEGEPGLPPAPPGRASVAPEAAGFSPRAKDAADSEDETGLHVDLIA